MYEQHATPAFSLISVPSIILPRSATTTLQFYIRIFHTSQAETFHFIKLLHYKASRSHRRFRICSAHCGIDGADCKSTSGKYFLSTSLLLRNPPNFDDVFVKRILQQGLPLEQNPTIPRSLVSGSHFLNLFQTQIRNRAIL